jgi:hypothetical protein
MVRAYARVTRGRLVPSDVVSMAVHGVTARYIEEMASLGVRQFTADELVQMRIHGVTPEYVRSLQQGGMTQLSADQLVRLRLAGFTPGR